MISEAVADGTIQLTPNGPLILLRHRQTVGGYPRIFNVISADVDILAQVAPNCLIQFKKVTRSEALKVLKQQQHDLKYLSKNIDGSKPLLYGLMKLRGVSMKSLTTKGYLLHFNTINPACLLVLKSLFFSTLKSVYSFFPLCTSESNFSINVDRVDPDTDLFGLFLNDI